MADTEYSAQRPPAEPPEATDVAALNLKKRARRRLVGAAALALLAATVLPIVMDQEPKPTVQDIQIRIPSQDSGSGNFASRILPAKPMATPLPPVESKAVAAPDVEKSELVVPLPALPSAAAPPERPVEKPAADAAQKSAPKSLPDDGRAKAILEGTTESPWIVQLGAFQDSGHVKVLLGKIKELGYPSYTEKVDTARGSSTRVRAGPFPTRELAEKAQARLKKIGAGGPPGGVVAQK